MSKTQAYFNKREEETLNRLLSKEIFSLNVSRIFSTLEAKAFCNSRVQKNKH